MYGSRIINKPADYLMKAIAAEMLNNIIAIGSVSNMNMWIADNLYIFTVDSSDMESPIAILFRTALLNDYADTIIKFAFSSIFY